MYEEFNAYEEQHNEIIFKIQPSWHLVIDDYDEAIGSIELSHRESDGYNIVSCDKVDSEKIDFSWMLPEDRIISNIDSNIQEVVLNCNNIGFSQFKSQEKFTCTINMDNAGFHSFKTVNNFLENNSSCISQIHFVNCKNRLFEKIISSICKKRNLESTFSLIEKDDKNAEITINEAVKNALQSDATKTVITKDKGVISNDERE